MWKFHHRFDFPYMLGTNLWWRFCKIYIFSKYMNFKSQQFWIKPLCIINSKLNQHVFTAIPNKELQGFYMEIGVKGNSNYMLWQCTGFAGSFFVVKRGIPCIYYWILFDFITLTFMQSIHAFPYKISLSQGKACNSEMETNIMLALLFYVDITGKIM